MIAVNNDQWYPTSATFHDQGKNNSVQSFYDDPFPNDPLEAQQNSMMTEMSISPQDFYISRDITHPQLLSPSLSSFNKYFALTSSEDFYT